MIKVQTPDMSIVRLSRWLLHYVLRRWPGLLIVLATMFLKTGLDVLKPWPMKILIDHVLQGKTMPDTLSHWVALLPGASTREGLLTWSVAGTVVIFLLGWALSVASSMANIGFGQRMV